MARKPAQGAGSGEPTPTLKAVAEQGAADRATELAEKAARAGIDTTPLEERESAPAAPAEKPVERAESFDYEKWYEAQPQEAREAVARNVVTNFTARLKETLGDDAFAVLEQAAQDEAYRNKLGRLNKKELREYVFDTAYSIYDDPRYTTAGSAQEQAGVADPRVDELSKKVSAFEQRERAQTTEGRRNDYFRAWQNDVGALLHEFPQLNYDASAPESSGYKRVAEIVDRAHYLSEKQYGLDEFGIPRGRVSLRDVYDRSRALDDTRPSPPPKIPNTSPSGDAPSRQAPRTDVESRNRMRETIEKHGSLKNLANALKG